MFFIIATGLRLNSTSKRSEAEVGAAAGMEARAVAAVGAAAVVGAVAAMEAEVAVVGLRSLGGADFLPQC